MASSTSEPKQSEASTQDESKTLEPKQSEVSTQGDGRGERLGAK